MEIRSRIAPTPSGYLHFGNIFSFVITWLYTRKLKGKLLLRIDDLDKLRIKTKYIEDIFTTLEWLEIDYDQGPVNTTDFLKNYSQLHRINLYADLFHQLEVADQLFACQCTRKQIQEISTDGQYPGTCLKKQNDLNMKNASVRLKTKQNERICFNDIVLNSVTIDLYEKMRNPVLRRKDGLFAYQIASLADDIYYNINTIIRGVDLLSSTALQIYLAKSLQKNDFLQNSFLHHKLIKNHQNQKISKSQQASPVHLWKNKKNGKAQLFKQIAVLLNVDTYDISNINDLLLHFDDKIIKKLGEIHN